MNGPEDDVEQVTCSACRVANAPGTKFCTSCGHELAVSVRPARRGRRRVSGDAAERSRGRQEFGRIKQIVLTVRAVFWSCSLLALVQVAVWHLIAAKEDMDLGAGLGLVLTAVFWGELALVLAGALRVLHAPLLWTAIGACYWSLSTTLQIAIQHGGSPGPFDIARLFMAVAFWFAVAQAARVQRLLAADPSLQLVRKRLAPEQRVAGGVAENARQRQRQARGKALRTAGALLALLVLGCVAIYVMTRPPSADATLRAFADRWQRHDAAGVLALFEGGEGSAAARELREELEQRGWLDDLPALGEVERREGPRPDRVVGVQWSSGGHSVQAVFSRREHDWHLERILLPPWQPPEPDAAIAAFRRAWAADGCDALVQMFRPASRERYGGALQRMLERREWGERRPALGDDDPGRVRGARIKVLFALGSDELGVSFEYWHPQWHVVGVSLPRE